MSNRADVRPPKRSDDDLVEGCKSRSFEAYHRLFEIYGARMKSIACNILNNTEDAEDAVQETFLKIYQNVERYKADAAFYTWIVRILVNACHDSMRRRRRRSAELQESESGTDLVALADKSPADYPLRLSLEKSLRQLDQRSRMVFLLYEVEGFKHSEIAEVLRIPEGTSKNILFHAKRELQTLLSGEDRMRRPPHGNTLR